MTEDEYILVRRLSDLRTAYRLIADATAHAPASYRLQQVLQTLDKAIQKDQANVRTVGGD